MWAASLHILMLSRPVACPVMGTHPNLEMKRQASRPSRPQGWACDRSRTIVVRPRRSWRSARASEPRENRPARQIAVEPLPAQTLHTSADQMVSWCGCGRSSCPPAGSAEGAALRRELHSCFADQPRYELNIRTPCHHGHARPIGQPNKRPDEGGSLYDECACVAHNGPRECRRFHPRRMS